MTKRQIAILNGSQTTALQLEKNILVWPSHLKFAANVAEFRAVVAEIFIYKSQQEINVKAANAYKQQAREAMAYKSIKVRSAVQNYASDKGDQFLYDAINFPEWMLLYGRQLDSLSKATIIAQIAKDNITHLVDYKLTDADMENYDTSIKEYQDAIPMVQGLIVERKNATGNLKLLFKELRKIIMTKLKPGLTQFMETAPDFYKEMNMSFEIKDQATHFTEFEMLVADEVTHEMLSGVKVTATSSKGEMKQFSNPIGEVMFKQFEADYWNLTFEFPGYVTKEIKTLKANLGKKRQLGTIELVKEAE